jgi:two-component system, OmpR family, phosphate regulon sensor histidine kinase PhoR
VKKLFSLITVLITLSLIGIIALQISWLKSNMALREDQVRQKIENALASVGSEFTQMKAQDVPADGNDALSIFPRRLNFLKPHTIGAKLSTTEIYAKIRKAFDNVGLKEMNFEYALVYGSLQNAMIAIEKQSAHFVEEQADSVHNYQTYVPILSQSGTAYEGISNEENLVLVAPHWKKFVIKSLMWNIILSIIFTIIILAAFYVTVYAMIRQKKLGDVKNDFINNMTHELKTPIATISLAVDALKNEKVLANRDKMSYFNSIIKEENQRMNKQVETILKASQFEKNEANVELMPLHIHEIIYKVVDNFTLQLRDKSGNAELKLNATNDVIKADEVHFANLVNNLVDNAVKYSKENVPIHIKITSQNINGKLALRFEDNGIGMSKETQRRVFEKFYRAHTGNLHNVKGFGLGLSYVKSVTQTHHGSVKLESTLGKGSTFLLEFPSVSIIEN